MLSRTAADKVFNRADINFPMLRKYFGFAEGAGSPVGSVTPEFVGQGYYDTTNENFYVATGLTSADWKATGASDLTVDQIKIAVETVTDYALPGYGTQKIAGDSVGSSAYTCAAPVAGQDLVIYCTAGDSVKKAIVTFGDSVNGITVGASTGKVATFDAAGECLHLRALSTTKWGVVANTGSVAIS